VAERIALMEEVFLPRRDWILSGSFTSWGAPIVPRLTHVVFLVLPGAKRLARLRRRERLRADPDLTRTPEWQAANRGFLDWAMSYDDPGFRGRQPRRARALARRARDPGDPDRRERAGGCGAGRGRRRA
jgi:hypothetical protein